MRWGHVQEWPPGQRVHGPAGTLKLCVCSERLASARQRRVTAQVARLQHETAKYTAASREYTAASRTLQKTCSQALQCSYLTVTLEPFVCVTGSSASCTPARVRRRLQPSRTLCVRGRACTSPHDAHARAQPKIQRDLDPPWRIYRYLIATRIAPDVRDSTPRPPWSEAI